MASRVECLLILILCLRYATELDNKTILSGGHDILGRCFKILTPIDKVCNLVDFMIKFTTSLRTGGGTGRQEVYGRHILPRPPLRSKRFPRPAIPYV